MPIKHFSKVFAVRDAKVAALLTDAEGAAPTYATPIDVPGIKSVTVSGDVEVKTLRGDNKQLDADSVITAVNVEFEYAKSDLDILAMALDSTVTDSGTGGTEQAQLDILGSVKLMPFKFEAVSVGADTITGDVFLTLWKVVLSSFPELGFAEEDYKTNPLSGSASPLLSTDQWVSHGFRATAGDAGSAGTLLTVP